MRDKSLASSPTSPPSSPTSPDRLVAFASYIQGEALPSSHPFNAPALASRLKSLGISFGEKTVPLGSLVGCTECDIRRDRLPPLPMPTLPLLSSPTTTPSSIPDDSDSTRGEPASRDSKENEEEKEEMEEMQKKRRGWKSKGTLSTLKKLERELVTLQWIYSLSPSPPPPPTPTRHTSGTGIESDTLVRQWRQIQHCMPLLAAYVRERAKAVKMYRLLGPEGEGGEVILGGGWDGCGWWERATRDPWKSSLTSTRASTVAA